jgi:hypothetical protein
MATTDPLNSRPIATEGSLTSARCHERRDLKIVPTQR